jgi:hypothetical protein
LIVIKNSPTDAYDANKWNDYLWKNHSAQRAVRTCALINDLLVQVLVKQQEISLKKIKDSLVQATPMDAISIALIAVEQEHN